MVEGFLIPARENFLDLTQSYLLIYPAEETMWSYGQLSRLLRESGTPIGDNDPWIACTALEIDAELVTRDRRYFDHVPTLRVIPY